jgi:alpha-galactosidase
MRPRGCARSARSTIVSETRSPLSSLTRRELLGAAIALPLYRAFGQPSPGWNVFRDSVKRARGFAVGAGGADVAALELTREWSGTVCRSRLTNRGTTAAPVREVVLFDLDNQFQLHAPIYGESFQMLSQTGGVLADPQDIGSYSDAKHYRIPTPEGTHTLFGAVTLATPYVNGGYSYDALGFTSTRRFAGLFRLRSTRSVQVIVDTEGLTLAPGESWDLEELTVATYDSRHAALSAIGRQLATNHPRLPWPKPPAGWCSWYCFGPRVTAQNILDNLDVIAKTIPGLTYVQIDDGYQPAMGDWLETGPAFGGDVRTVLDAIKARGFQPAIWVAPFVAEKDSHVFQQHPDWFVKDTDGSPLRSDTVTFGGWRRGPWYVLDGTHPDVQAHFVNVFSTMHREWGVTYFKLDANFWGAIHGGRFHDPKATRIEAYRRGMQAIIRGAGDSFILGCNHPIWPSAGLIHGSRSSNDIKRTWDRIRTTAQQNLLRNWQNGLLWWNDPDAICLAGDLPEHEFIFHATAIYATGGMVLSGDDLTAIPPKRLAMLKKLLPPTGVAAVFDESRVLNDADGVARVTLENKQMVCVFNSGERAWTLPVALPVRSQVRDFWTGESLGRRRSITLTLPPRSARLLECTRG